MSEQNIVNVMVIPDVPKVLPGEQLYVYVPKASFTSPGIIAYNSEQFEIDGNFLFIRKDYVSPGVTQKIAELKEYTDGKLQLKQDKEDNNISLAQRPEQKSVVGAINDLGTLTQEAKNAADQAQATANGAVTTANEAKTIAQTAENNANSAVDKADNAIDRANKAYEKAANNVYAVGFMTLQEAITAVNGYDNTVLKTNDNILVVAQGSPDLYVTSVEATNIPYNFTTVDKFNDDLVKNTVLQIGYYKVAFYETDGQPVTVAYQNVVVKSTDWVASTEFADFPYEAKIELTDFVDYTTVPQVVFDIADTMSGNYAPICKSGDKCVYIYGKTQDEITLKTVITFAPNVNGASVTGGGYNNRGKWVASTTYAIDDLVYTDNGQFVCIEGITSTTSPEQDTMHWQATFVATGKTKNGLKFSGQNGNGTEVQKTFDGSAPVEVAFDENTMTAKEVNGVLEIGAKGTIPTALPQEASALKSGNLPTSGWEQVAAPFWEGELYVGTSLTEVAPAGTVPEALRQDTSLSNWSVKYAAVGWVQPYSTPSIEGANLKIPYSGTQNMYVYPDGSIYAQSVGSTYTYYGIKNKTYGKQTYTISDTSITANSDILMELTDEGRVKAYSMEAGKITVIRDTVPTQPIPYTYKVKQTNASGQFTLVNHFVPEVPESPTSLPVTYKKASGSLPTSGWTVTDRYLYNGEVLIGSSAETYVCDVPDIYLNQETQWKIQAGSSSSQQIYENQTLIRNTDSELSFHFTNVGGGSITVTIKINKVTKKAYAINSAQSIYLYKIWNGNVGMQAYTITDTFITANTSVKMYLTDEGGVKAQSKANGSITVIRDAVPTAAIPYEYEVEQTSAEGLFEVINAYVPSVPTKTSDLQNDSGFIKPTEENTFTAEQTFSNANGIKTNRAHNLNGNAWYDFDGTNDRLGSLATPTIIRTSEARPKAEVPSGSATVTKEIALLEDVPGALGEWVTVAGETATLTEAGTYQVVFYGGDRNVQSIIYWDGTTAAEGTYSTVVDLLEGRPVMASRFPQITAEGVISFGWVTISQTVQGDWTESNTTASGFKYRKIN